MQKLIRRTRLKTQKETLTYMRLFTYRLLACSVKYDYKGWSGNVRVGFNKYGRWKSVNYIKKNCYFTFRGRGNLSIFGFSRFKFKELAWQGLLPGVKRLSW